MTRQATEDWIAKPVLDLLDLPVLALDEHGHVLFTNGAAEEILRDGNCFFRRNGCLAARSKSIHGALETLLGVTLRGERAGLAFVGPRERRRLYAVGVPLRGGLAYNHHRSCALLLLFDGRRVSGWDDRLLAQMLGLTPAEGRLAQSLMLGKTVAQHATSIRVAVSTARSQLKHILAKMGMHSQVELVRLLSRMPSLRDE